MTKMQYFAVLILVFALVCVSSGLGGGLAYPYDNGGPGFEHTTAYNEAHGLTGPGVEISPFLRVCRGV